MAGGLRARLSHAYLVYFEHCNLNIIDEQGETNATPQSSIHVHKLNKSVRIS